MWVPSPLDPLFMSIAEDYVNTSRDKGASRQGMHTSNIMCTMVLVCVVCGWNGGRC